MAGFKTLCAAVLLLLAVGSHTAAAQATPKTVADLVIANKNKGFSVLLEAVLAADPSILAALSNPDLVATVFAPNNYAFNVLLKKLKISKAALLANKPLLNKVLMYHVFGLGAVKSTDLKARQTVETLLKGLPGKLSILKSATGVTLTTSSGQSGIKVFAADLVAGKSIVHLIQGVLIPK